MGYDLWNHSKFVHHKVRNMVRRGWLKKTYNDGKLLKGRVQTGEKIENDDLDILHPVGMVAHVEPGDKMEVFTTDVGGDTSRRVISQVIGDREEHPQPDENEVFFYAPNDKKVFTRYKKKRSQSQQQRAQGDQSNNRTKESGREPGMHSDADDLKVSSTTQNTNRLNADAGIGNKTQANHTIDAGSNTQFEAGNNHLRIGGQRIDTQGKNIFVKGVVLAHDHAVGSTTVSKGAARRAAPPIGMPDMADGSETWTATEEIYPPFTSLLSVNEDLQDTKEQQEQQNQEIKQEAQRVADQVNQLADSLFSVEEFPNPSDPDHPYRILVIDRNGVVGGPFRVMLIAPDWSPS